MARSSIEEAASRTRERYGMLGISVEGAIDIGVAEACRTSRRLQQLGMIRLSTFGRVRGAGFALLADLRPSALHPAVARLSEVTLARIDRCFDDTIPNPAHGAGGSVE